MRASHVSEGGKAQGLPKAPLLDDRRLMSGAHARSSAPGPDCFDSACLANELLPLR